MAQDRLKIAEVGPKIGPRAAQARLKIGAVKIAGDTAPGSTQHRRSWAQDRPKPGSRSAPSRSQEIIAPGSAQHRQRCAHDHRRRAQDRRKIAEDWPNIGPSEMQYRLGQHCRRDSPKIGPISSNIGPRSPKLTQDRLKIAEDGPKIATIMPKMI